MIIITGAAGFIGRATRDALRRRGEQSLLAVDNVPVAGFNHQLSGAQFRASLARREFDRTPPKAIFHFAAVDSRADRKVLLDTNVTLSQEIINWCIEHGVRCIYASTCSVYGRDSFNTSDDHSAFERFTPINAYAEAKLMLDIWARDMDHLDRVVGLRYYSVYGPDQTASSMSGGSFILKQFPNLNQRGCVEVFKSTTPGLGDGEATRDFVYIKDLLKIHLYFLDHDDQSGIYNVGSGQARTFNDAARAMFAAVDKEPNTRYRDMPESVRATWTDAMQANITKLRAACYTAPLTTLEAGVHDYLMNYLVPARRH